ncbi:MAG: NAD+ synthase [archaeon]
MKENPRELLKIDEESTEKKIIDFIKENTKGLNGIVIGLSGGIDSAVCATLATKALGKDKVFALLMPGITTPKEDIKDAIELAEHLGIEYKVVDIKDIYESIKNNSFSKDRVSQGNIMARIRMILLRDYAHSKNLLVLGTGNRSELMIGYFTKNGDSGVDLLPIGDLYKTQVRALAKHLNISGSIIQKAPSAGLWKDQTDEKEIGMTYETLDMILAGLEQKQEAEELSQIIKVSIDKIAKVKDLISRSRHKTEPIPYPIVR